MASNKRQFLAMYQESVQLLRNFKQSNDQINKSIGIQNDSSIFLKIRADQHKHNMNLEKLDKLLDKLQQSYLDPDTARKIGAVKQQYKMQKDRREHLIDSVQQYQHETEGNYIDHINSTNNLGGTSNYAHSHQNLPQNKYLTKSNKNDSNGYRQKINNNQDDLNSQTTTNTITQQSQFQEQLTGYDYEIQSKLIHQRNQALKQAQHSLMNVYNISKQTAEMVNYQGEQLDIISDEIFKTGKNTQNAMNNLQQANENQKKSKRKYVAMSLIIIVAATALIFMLAL